MVLNNGLAPGTNGALAHLSLDVVSCLRRGWSLPNVCADSRFRLDPACGHDDVLIAKWGWSDHRQLQPACRRLAVLDSSASGAVLWSLGTHTRRQSLTG